MHRRKLNQRAHQIHVLPESNVSTLLVDLNADHAHVATLEMADPVSRATRVLIGRVSSKCKFSPCIAMYRSALCVCVKENNNL